MYRDAHGTPDIERKVGLFGTCSGGRHAYLTACRLGDAIDGVVDCWGGNVVAAEDALTPAQPSAPADLIAHLNAPLLGIFGNDDHNPTREDVDKFEEVLRSHNKEYMFHRYEGAGHFFYRNRPSAYRAEAAVDGWEKVWSFLDRHLS
jgi:carboxymethylenebutenolidase